MKNKTEVPACSVLFTDEDWQSSYSVRIKAVTDQIYDRDHVLVQTISTKFIVAGATVKTETIQTEVYFFSMHFSV